MKDDLENQSAAFLAKEADPQGLRTIGVLTKPDTLQSGEHQQWLDVLHGRRHVLRHGYYVTKQPGTSELADKLPYEEARRREAEFFATASPWNSVEASINARMGVKNLTQELSRLLSRLIEQTLPKLRTQSRSSKTETEEALLVLPPKVSENPTGELFRLVTSFCQKLDKVVVGSEGNERLIQDCRKAYEQFKTDIRSTTPIFHARSQSRESSPDTISLASLEFNQSTSNCLVMDVDDVRAYIAKSITRQLPYNTPFSCKVRLVEQCFKTWPAHADEAFDSVYRAFKGTIDDIVAEHFSRFENGGLTDYTGNIVETLLNSVRDETSGRIKWLLELEDPPFTMNDHYFSSYREKYLAVYKGERHGSVEYDALEMKNALAAIRKLGFKIDAIDLEKLRGPDPYEQEMIVMAEVRAYFQVAYKRIIDMLPRVIDHDFLKGLSKRMHDVLVAKLGLDQDNASHRAAHWLSEDPDVVRKRAELEAKKGRLEEVLNKLHDFSI